MKILQIIVVCMALLSISKSAKDGDEGKPYEFGFTIDGEQHRYEKRDANGIIQGEFGFITADGIYHVTTYATDENGSFRILSMRNVRISDPLDGSGGGHGPKVPASEVQAAGRKAQQVQQATAPAKPQQPVPPTKLQQLQQPAPPTILQQPQQPPTSTIAFVPPTFSNQIIQTTTRRAPLVFTTQPTLKPACASCGYVTYPSTTPKPITQSSAQHIPINKPNEIESFQNGQGQFNQAYSTTPSASLVFGSGPTADSFAQENFKPGDVQRPQVPSGGIPQTQPIPISQNNLAVNVNGHSTSNGQSLPQNIESFGGSPRAFPAVPGGTQTQQFSPSQPQQFSPSQPQQFSPSQPQQFSPSQPVGPIPSQRQPKLSDQFSSDPSPLGPVIPAQQSLNETPSAYVQPPAFSQQQQPQTPDNTNAFNQVPGPAPSLPAINNFAAPQINSQLPAVPQVTDRSRVDDIKVENGMILVPNNAPIKIKDKYPGMVDGLPQGIEENDIKDLLYKFNYTIGFHGHYEKGYKDGSKIGGYFVNGRDGISRVVTYVADAYGYRPKFRLINLGLESTDTPKEDTEKTFGLKNFEFVWYPLN